MKTITVETKLTVYDTIQTLPKYVQELMAKARKAKNKAYAPYSQFNVGAAILLDNKQVITGNNQENASYPSGLCAERTAIYYAGATFPQAIMQTMCVAAGSQNQETKSPIPPCGACRQAIAEYEIKQNHPIEIYFMGETGKVIKSHSLANLLPFIFDKSQL